MGLLISTCLLVILIRVPLSTAQEHKLEAKLAILTASQSHPLPFTLAQWQDPQNSGDYFFEVKMTEVGYLVWSQFPIKVYIQPYNQSDRLWIEPVIRAVQEWNYFLPLQVVDNFQTADIRIVPKVPPLQTTNFLRARSAQTRYQLYVNSSKPAAILSHYCTILLNPRQSSRYIQAAARHELGHALGIWGHSPEATDALYFSQVSDIVPISSRDINTLKRVYQQPTRLGWQVAANSQP
ncbi:peptidase [Aliterella atlantica CENA595]|uniref:Peptidase n=1 Tax=Aliterella atlantica CENA595 TaxID=1618023 RepID=A0A0D8ZTX5_9CYAN|nr:peptidase [Aliterella atlantica CENA595]